MEPKLSRRDFLIIAGVMGLGALLTACAQAQPSIATTTLTPAASMTASLPPMGETEEGSTKPTATAPAPEATQAVSEIDLEPAFTQETNVEYMGVKIHAELITDKSLDPSITKVTVPDKTYAEFIARSIFKVWWKKGIEAHTGVATEADFTSFMALWATAQQSGLAEDWQKVQIDNIWANDLQDGNGYVQSKYFIWPMFSGSAPEGIRGIETMSIALVNGQKVNNIYLLSSDPKAGGAGTNIEGKVLYIYRGINSTNKIGSILGGIADTAKWLLRNSSIKGVFRDSALESFLYNLLKNGGLTIE